MRSYQTRAQRYAIWALRAGAFLVLLCLAGLNIHATITCAPQAGKWTPLTGKVCYGE